MKQIHHSLIIICISLAAFLIIFANCASQQQVHYDYADGSGNQYIITCSEKTTLEYMPVDPKNSSSGDYSGGTPVKKDLTKKQYETIAALIGKARKNKNIHIKNRTKGSGAIVIKQDASKTEFIIKYKSEEQLQLEKYLQKIIKE